jgi:CheY-like chemotaxis protein
MCALSTGQRMQSARASYNILLIEDDEATCEMLIECIESESAFCVRSLPSGEEALQHLQECREPAPSLFIIDYLLPGMHGLQLLDHLVSLETFKQVPAIIITATNLTDDLQTSLHDRNMALLPKPLDLNDLIDYLEYIRHTSFQQLL